MSSIVLSGNTSGAITLSSPAVSGTNTATFPAATGTVALTTSVTGFKNRIINGNMVVSQRNGTNSQTITAAAALAYTVDRWYAYCTGANVTGAQVAGASTSSQFLYQFTGAASVTAIGFGQRIEAKNCFDLANTTATLSCYISNSLLTSVTWTAYYATTTDSFGTVASPTRTSIATGTFTVSSTRAQYTASISVPSAATTGIEILFTVGAQTSGTWIIDSVQLEAGSVATTFDTRSYGDMLLLCERYYFRYVVTAAAQSLGSGYCSSTTVFLGATPFPVTMRTVPTALEQSGTAADYRIIIAAATNVACSAVPTFSSASVNAADTTYTVASGLTAGQGGIPRSAATTAYLGWSAEL
jgi:hypothetical protein